MATGFVNDYLRVEKVWHAYGGFQAKSEVINVAGAGQWAFITNAGNNLWTGSEGDGLTLSGDVMTFANGGDYFGSVSFTFSGLNGKDFLFRVYNITKAAQAGLYIGATTTGATNFTSVNLPLYLEIDAGNQLRMEVTCSTDGSDPTMKESVFYLSYLHD